MGYLSIEKLKILRMHPQKRSQFFGSIQKFTETGTSNLSETESPIGFLIGLSPYRCEARLRAANGVILILDFPFTGHVQNL